MFAKKRARGRMERIIEELCKTEGINPKVERWNKSGRVVVALDVYTRLILRVTARGITVFYEVDKYPGHEDDKAERRASLEALFMAAFTEVAYEEYGIFGAR